MKEFKFRNETDIEHAIGEPVLDCQRRGQWSATKEQFSHLGLFSKIRYVAMGIAGVLMGYVFLSFPVIALARKRGMQGAIWNNPGWFILSIVCAVLIVVFVTTVVRAIRPPIILSLHQRGLRLFRIAIPFDRIVQVRSGRKPGNLSSSGLVTLSRKFDGVSDGLHSAMESTTFHLRLDNGKYVEVSNAKMIFEPDDVEDVIDGLFDSCPNLEDDVF